MDGSVGGVPNSFILINDGDNDSIAVDTKDCEIKPTWNAAVCKGDVGRWILAAPAAAAVSERVAQVLVLVRVPVPAGCWSCPNSRSSRSCGPGGPAGPGGGLRGGGAGAPAQPPVVLSRNGKEYNLTRTNVLAGTEIKVTTERPSMALSLSELDSGSWVMFELPGFTTAASGTPQDSLDALRKASATSYYKGKDSLWVKVVSNGKGADGGGPGAGGASLQVSR